MSISRLEQCSCLNHIFKNPLCQSQTLIRRVANVALHILTLCIPLIIYRAVSYVVSKFSNPQPNPKIEKPKINEDIISNIVKNIREDIEPTEFHKARMAKPDTQMAKLIATWGEARARFDGALTKHAGTNANELTAWNQDEVVEAADHFIEVSYAVSVLTVRDLLEYSKSKKKSALGVIEGQSSYHYKTFFCLPNAYTNARQAITMIKGRNGQLLLNQNQIKKSESSHPFWMHIHNFYISGTVQNKWRSLFNNYCSFVDELLDKDQLKVADERFTEWTKQDEALTWSDDGTDAFTMPLTVPT